MTSDLNDILPDRPLTFNELETLAAKVRDAIRLQALTVPNDQPSIRNFLFITDQNVHALHFEAGSEEWECVFTGETPDGAFAGEYITNEDHNREVIQEGFHALEMRKAESEQ